MSALNALVLACQISVGVGSGNSYVSADSIRSIIDDVQQKQKKCQKELALCVYEHSKKDVLNLALLKCLKEQG